MPRNRADKDRATKVTELLDAAEALFVADGYEGATMAEIATKAGVAANAIYWYFPSKDDLFVAVADRLVTRTLAELAATRRRSPVQQAQWAIAQFRHYQRLTAAVHDRARSSGAVAELHERFHATLSSVVTELAKDAGVANKEARLAAAAFVTFLEGALLHDQDDDFDQVVSFLVRRLVS